MNCKPGQLAMIVRSRPTDSPDAHALVHVLLGMTVRVVQIRYAEMWQIEDPIRVSNVRLNERYMLVRADITGIDDYYLMPIDGLPVKEEVSDDIKEPA